MSRIQYRVYISQEDIMNRYNRLVERCRNEIKKNDYEHAFITAYESLNAYVEEGLSGEISNVFFDNHYIYPQNKNDLYYLKYMKDLIKILGKEERFYDQAKTVYRLAVNYIESHIYDEGEILLKQGLDIAESIHAFDIEADIYNGYGNIYGLQGDSKEALRYYLRAYNHAKKHNYKDGIRFATNIATAYSIQGKYDSSIRYFKEVNAYLKESDQIDHLANSENELGRAYIKANQLDDAILTLKKAKHHSEITGSFIQLLDNYMFQSEYYESISDYKTAYHMLKEREKLNAKILKEKNLATVKALVLNEKVDIEKNRNEEIQKKNFELSTYSQLLKDKNEALLESMKETEALNRQLHQNEKNESYSRIMIGISHRVNTALSNISLISNQMKDQVNVLSTRLANNSITKSQLTDFMTKTADTMDIVMESANKTSSFISAIKESRFTLQEIGKTGEISSLIMDSISTFSDIQYDYDYDFDFFVAEYLPPIKSYSILKNVLIQLIDNSLKYGFSANRDNRINIQVDYNEDNNLEIKYFDNGKGINEDLTEKIFEPFYTSNMGYNGGAGIGLYILKRTVEDVLNGSVHVHSNIDEGFEITLIFTDQMFDS